jgi:hypothetical protein
MRKFDLRLGWTLVCFGSCLLGVDCSSGSGSTAGLGGTTSAGGAVGLGGVHGTGGAVGTGGTTVVSTVDAGSAGRGGSTTTSVGGGGMGGGDAGNVAGAGGSIDAPGAPGAGGNGGNGGNGGSIDGSSSAGSGGSLDGRALAGAGGGIDAPGRGGAGGTVDTPGAGGIGGAVEAGGGAAGSTDNPMSDEDVSDPLPVPFGATTLGGPAVGFSQDKVLAVWPDSRSLNLGDQGGLYATRIRISDQKILDPAGVRILTNTSFGSVSYQAGAGVRVVSDGTDFLALYNCTVGASISSSCCGSFIDGTSGDPIDTVFTVGSGTLCDAVFDGTSYWVGAAWSTGVVVTKIDPKTRSKTNYNLSGPKSTTSVSIAAGPNEVVVAWADGRFYSADKNDIYVARISKDGTVLDASGVVVCDDPRDQTSAGVVFDGSQYLVTWQDERSTDRYRAHFDPVTGTVSPRNGEVFTGLSPAAKFYPEGDALAAQWWSGGTFSQMFAERFQASDLTALAPAVQLTGDIVVRTDTVPSFATDGTHRYGAYYFNGGISNNQIVGYMWDTAGNPIGAGTVQLVTHAAAQLPPAAVAGAGQYLVSWFEQDSTSGYGVRVSMASAQGHMLSPAAVELASNVAAATSGQGPDPTMTVLPPALGWAGGAFVVAWQQQSAPGTDGTFDLYVAGISAAGAVTTPTPISVGKAMTGTGSTLSPAMACTADRCLLTWHQITDSAYKVDVRAAVITLSSTALDVGAPFDVISAGGTQQLPAVASDGTGFLVAWRDDKSGTNDLYMTLVSAAGTVIGSPTLLHTATSKVAQPAAQLVFDGANYEAVWRGGGGMSWGRINPSTGARLDGEGLLEASTGSSSFISRVGAYTVFLDPDANRATRVDATGAVLSETPVTLPAGVTTAPRQSLDGLFFFTQAMHPERPYENERVRIHHFAY